MTLFSGLGTDVHFSGDETGLQREDSLFEMQNAVEWRMVMSRGQDEGSQMHAMSLLLSTCEGMTNRVLIDGGAKWILQGSEQEQRDWTDGVKALNRMLASTTSGRAKELVKQGLSDRIGMITVGRIRERCAPLVWRSSQTCFSSSGHPLTVGGQVAEMAEADEAS